MLQLEKYKKRKGIHGVCVCAYFIFSNLVSLRMLQFQIY